MGSFRWSALVAIAGSVYPVNYALARDLDTKAESRGSSTPRDNPLAPSNLELFNAVYVDAATGDDANVGYSYAPKKTIQAAVDFASALFIPRPVFVANGVYDGFEMRSDVRVHGGFNPANGWTRDGSGVTRVVAQSTIVSPNGYVPTAVGADLVDNAMLDQLEIEVLDQTQPGLSAYAIFIGFSVDLVINNCTVIAGQGATGIPGMKGQDGLPGGHGTTGQPGCEFGNLFCDVCLQPQGGAGGVSPFGLEGGSGGLPGLGLENGFDGQPGFGPAPGAGGPGTIPRQGQTCPGPASWGQDGAPGAHGADGIGGASIGNLFFLYGPADGTSGQPGFPGSGGGGGGGGGGGTNDCDSYGSGGGGGGAGGSEGQAGQRGLGGRGSFGVYLFASSDITITNSTLITVAGAPGGSGGTGGIGGPGGFGYDAGEGCGATWGGTAEQDDGSMGGAGGDGGPGGDGGDGGGGGGGPSITVISEASAPVALGGNTYLNGPGGPGGASNAPGQTGLSAATLIENIVSASYGDDCNNNNMYDAVDIADGILTDEDCDGIPDLCDPDFCGPDTNDDGILDNGDINAFVALFLAGDPAADFTGDSILDNGDINAFVVAFLAGC